MQLRPIALIRASLAGLIVAISGSSSLALTEATPRPRQLPASPNLISQGAVGNACDLDTRLAAQVIRNSIFDRTYNTRSIITIQGSSPGLNFDVEAQVTTLTQAPGQFRSEIIFADANTQNQSKYLVTSNGEQTWIYDKIGDRYASMSYEGFDDSDDSFLMGFMANLGLMLQADFSDIEAMRQLSEAQLVMVLKDTIAPCQASELSVALQTINGQSYQSFGFEDKAEGFTMTGFMNRQTGKIDYFTLNGNNDGMDFQLNEKTISRTAMAEVAATTFEFIPPATAQQAEEGISIGAF